MGALSIALVIVVIGALGDRLIGTALTEVVAGTGWVSRSQGADGGSGRLIGTVLAMIVVRRRSGAQVGTP